MTPDEYLISIGKIIGNMQGTELLLRLFLAEANKEKIEFPDTQKISYPITHLTDYSSLKDLIAKYNVNLLSAESSFHVDDSIVDIRDAFAHGRVFTMNDNFTNNPPRLFKFSKPRKDGLVDVVFDKLLDKVWLSESIRKIKDELFKVHACGKVRGYRTFSN